MPAEDDFERFSGLAEELGFEGDDHSNWVNKAMERKGYKAVMNWADPEPEEGKSGSSDMFGSGRKRETRQVGNRPSQRRNDSQYG